MTEGHALITAMPEKALLIPDTNVLLHALPIDKVPWPKLVQADEVVLVLVPQVLRELDLKKNVGSDKLKKRAKKVLAQISSWYLPGTTGQDVTIANGVALRLRAKEPAMVSDLDYSVADDRIVGAAIEVRTEGSARVVVISGDFSMRVKMETHGFRVETVPDAYRIRDEEGQQRQAAKEPRIVPGLFSEDSDEPRIDLPTKLGLSAVHLLPEAEDELRNLRNTTHVTTFDLRSMVGLYSCNRPINDPVAAIGLERSCAPAWHTEVSGLSMRRAAS